MVTRNNATKRQLVTADLTPEREYNLFTCGCGSTEITVEGHTIRQTCIAESSQCLCEDSAGEVRADRTITRSVSISKRGPLDDEHHWKWEEEEEIEVLDEAEVETNVFCNECQGTPFAPCGDAEPGPEILDEVFVRCGGCDRELEFGWSHPDRAGRIWPAECRDFNPWKCWPEPRYRDSWAKKGWLRKMPAY